MANKEQIAERHYQAWELRIRGFTFREIGEQLGISAATAMRWVHEVWDTKSIPTAEKIRAQELDRMERLLAKLDEDIERGDVKAIGTAIKLSERLCKLTGADMPVRTETTIVEATPLDSAIQNLLDEMNDRNAQAKRQAAMKGDKDED